MKCQDDSETKNWLTANTKPCPKCGKPVEKNGGCNLVVCMCGQVRPLWLRACLHAPYPTLVVCMCGQVRPLWPRACLHVPYPTLVVCMCGQVRPLWQRACLPLPPTLYS